MLTGSENGDDANAAFRLGVGYLRKPCPLALLEQFAARAAIGRGVDDPRVRAALRRLALRRGLTPREMAIVFAAFDGAEHARLAAVAGLAVSTIKRQVHVLLGKVGGATLRDLVIELQRDALRAPTR